MVFIMFRGVLVWGAIVVAVTAGRSPHADLVDLFEKSPDGARYSSNIFEDARLDLESLVRKYRYPFEAHTVVTEDGYILTAHRIPHGRDQNNQPGNKPVVVIMHGLISSSADFVVLGPGNALGYLLAEEGYDVWLLNARGNTFSRNHTTLDPDDRVDLEFWRFSWHEIGYYDIPAYLDYILEATSQTKVHYIGHSQGCTTFLIFASLRPEYNEKIIAFQGLAPAAYFYNNSHFLFTLIAPYERILEPLAFRIGLHEFLGQNTNNILSLFTFLNCRDGAALQPLCELLFINDQNSDHFNSTMLPVFLGHAPAGASIRQLMHYGQCIRFQTFSRYNFGSLQNLAIYGRVTPPPYDLSRVTTHSYLYYGLNDAEVNYKDVLILAESMPDARTIQVSRPGFTHYDFVWGVDAKEQLYDVVIRNIKEAVNL